jgi:hypothetical protein
MSKKKKVTNNITDGVVELVKEAQQQKIRYQESILRLQALLEEQLSKPHKRYQSLKAKYLKNNTNMATTWHLEERLEQMRTRYKSVPDGSASSISELLRLMTTEEMVKDGKLEATIALFKIGSPLKGEDTQELFAVAIDSATDMLRAKGFSCKFSKTCDKWNDERDGRCTGGCPMMCNGDHSYWRDLNLTDANLCDLFDKIRENKPQPHPHWSDKKKEVLIHITIDAA